MCLHNSCCTETASPVIKLRTAGSPHPPHLQTRGECFPFDSMEKRKKKSRPSLKTPAVDTSLLLDAVWLKLRCFRSNFCFFGTFFFSIIFSGGKGVVRRDHCWSRSSFCVTEMELCVCLHVYVCVCVFAVDPTLHHSFCAERTGTFQMFCFLPSHPCLRPLLIHQHRILTSKQINAGFF